MDTLKDVLNNKYFVGFVTVGTVLYASLARPALPDSVAKLFEHPLTKMIFYALIVLLMTQNLQVAIVVAIAFYVLMSMLREQRIAEGFIDGLRTEGFFNQRIERFYDQQKAEHDSKMNTDDGKDGKNGKDGKDGKDMKNKSNNVEHMDSEYLNDIMSKEGSDVEAS